MSTTSHAVSHVRLYFVSEMHDIHVFRRGNDPLVAHRMVSGSRTWPGGLRGPRSLARAAQMCPEGSMHTDSRESFLTHLRSPSAPPSPMHKPPKLASRLVLPSPKDSPSRNQ